MKKNKCLLVISILSTNFLISCADDQARAQIADTDKRLSQLQQSVGLLGTKVSNQKMLGILNQLDKMQNQIDQLSGEISNLKHNQQVYKETQEQFNKGIDQKFQNVEKSNLAQVNKESTNPENNNNDEELKVALDSIKNRDFKSAIKSLKIIIKSSKNSETIANASYFLAVSYAANGQYKEAVVTARKFVAANPENKYAPDALRTMYIAQNQLNWKQSAINTANTLFKKYPDSDAAKKVKQDLNNK